MCGVFGYVSSNGEAPDLGRLMEIAAVTERRGPHAFGFAWIDRAGRLKSFKKTGRITQHLGVLSMARDAVMFIGHCRYATQGDPANNLNNHPHPADGGWIVHNGVVGHYEQLVERYGLATVTDCDSEVLALLIEGSEGRLVQRCAGAVRVVRPGGPVVLLGLWPRPRRMIAARNGNPLSLGIAREGRYLASLPHGLPGRPVSLGDGDLIEFTHRKGTCHATLHEGIADGPAGDALDAFGEEGAACGGGLFG
jgi:glucosamine 6-phosphate synthetase-like amidotransferase/phosphosugar isomerase protein